MNYKNKEINFGDRITKIREGYFNQKLIEKKLLPITKGNKKVTHQELVDIIKTITGKDSGSKQSIIDWTTKNTLPKIDVVVALAEALDVSIEYMLGISDAMDSATEKETAPFRELGFTHETWELLNKHKEKVKETYNGSFLPDDYMLQDETMSVLNKIICYKNNVDNEDIAFPILDSIGSYLDISSLAPFHKIRTINLDALTGAFDSVYQQIFKDAISRPYTKEEIDEYINYNSLFCGATIDASTFRPEEDESCAIFIRTKRIAAETSRFLKGSSLGESEIEELESTAFYQLKMRLSKLKLEMITKSVEDLRLNIRILQSKSKISSVDKKANEIHIKRIQEEIDWLEELISYYEKE